MNFLDNIGLSELLIIFLLILLVVGPERLPEMGRKLAKFLRDVRKMYENATRDLDPEIGAIQQTVKEVMDSTREIASIPRDAVRTLTQAVSLDAPEAKPAVAGRRPVSNSPDIPNPLSKDGESARASTDRAPALATLPEAADLAEGPEERSHVPEAEELSVSGGAGREARLDG